MIVWRGIGGLVFVVFAGVFGIGYAVTAGPLEPFRWLIIGLLLTGAAVGVWFWGRAVNVDQVRKKIDRHIAQRAAYFEQLIQSGEFQTAMQLPQPVGLDEAHRIVDQHLSAERYQIQSKAIQPHTMFWIPMQWWAIPGAVIGVILFGVGVASLFSTTA